MRYVEFEAGGKSYNLRYDFNAISDLEQKAGAGVVKLFNEETIGFNTVRMLLWAGLKGSVPGLTIEGAGNIVADYIKQGGSVEELSTHITKALTEGGLFGKQGEGEVTDEPPFPKKESPKKSPNSKK